MSVSASPLSFDLGMVARPVWFGTVIVHLGFIGLKYLERPRFPAEAALLSVT
jgi:hypothetical protein